MPGSTTAVSSATSSPYPQKPLDIKTVSLHTVRRDTTVVENLNGVKVADPYRWLEDPDAAETEAFVEEQNKVTFGHLETYPYREELREQLTKLFDYEKYGCPFKHGEYYYYFYNSGLQPQSILYQQKSLTAEPTVFLDPNTLEADGTASLSTYGFSESGKLFGYGISKSGSDWITIHVKYTDASGQELEDEVRWAKFTRITWAHDDSGFFYNRYPKPSVRDDKAGTETGSNTDAMMCFHRIGTSQEEDVVVFKDPAHPHHLFGSEVTDDGKFLILMIVETCNPVNKLYIADLSEGSGGITDNMRYNKLVDNMEAEYTYVANDNSVFYFKTNLNAPKYKIVKYDLDNPQEGFVDVISEHNGVLERVHCTNKENLVIVYLEDVKNVVRIHDLKTGSILKEIPTPIGAVTSISTRREFKELFFSHGSFLNPDTIYRYSFGEGVDEEQKLSVFRTTQVSGFNSDEFITKQIFYPSKDGTKIPMFINHKKDLPLDGNNSTLLYGYGGFGISLSPMFSPAWIAFMKHFNGVVAIPNLRGGGEYGEEWHQAGTLARKQNVFDDFQYAAKYLIENKYTRPERLAINGGSNGGLLVGACMNQAPELFGCGVADVGVMDMLRFHKFTIGHVWKSDYGNPDNAEDFKYIYKYSPLHNVQTEKPYPPYMLTTGDHDDRVVPLHSHKLIATLQHYCQDNANPLLIRVDTKAGHGAGKPTQKIINEVTDSLSFMALSLKSQ
ncbi:prolyl endopeptidase-like protein [Basidiobolus meristosporus CBS 931.73]|uniref:Prolyl endopeptidase n=1 Tax=Basidiobolus meristosporus CBS 931.73 TaxID=1314790 RepID=A0A1Y1Y9N4_9FUNG|nr:prolyl endopeptidase-like protein [Basidiobolus meristosporus CBS 931.73]|eukprot:ORX94707.1 prolyl endopeptidase-like protein [Basidiobolus meristosporus CBS 931.73]